jgi:hypothetical protein
MPWAQLCSLFNGVCGNEIEELYKLNYCPHIPIGKERGIITNRIEDVFIGEVSSWD